MAALVFPIASPSRRLVVPRYRAVIWLATTEDDAFDATAGSAARCYTLNMTCAANTPTLRKQFDSIRARCRTIREQYDALRSRVEARSGAPYYVHAPRTAFDRVEAAYDRVLNVESEFFTLLDRISPRNWHTTVPALWVVNHLSWEDATTHGALSVMPPPSLGTSQAQIAAFATAVRQ